MKQYLKSFFSFSHSDQNGLMVIIVLIVIVITARHITNRNALKQNQSNLEVIIDSAFMHAEPEMSSITLSYNKGQTPAYFPFDPNTISFAEWKKLGLRDHQIENIQNYLATGARFQSKDDLRAIYTLSEKDVELLSPFIVFEKHTNLSENPENEEKPPEMISESKSFRIELNGATIEELKSIPGIGSVFSERIKKYQNLLGGFVSINQLKEVYGLSPQRVDSISSFIWVDSMLVNKLNLNSLTEDELKKHPYISAYDASAIVKYRSFKPFDSISVLIHEKILPEQTYMKVRPYLE